MYQIPRQQEHSFEPYDGLPPADMWLVPRDQLREPTPVDDRGFVDTVALISLVTSVIHPDYRWPRGTSKHHLNWPREAFEQYDRERGISLAVPFREAPVNIGILPRQVENVLHAITIPAPIPAPEHMRARLEAWSLAHELFKNIRDAVQLERRARRRATFLEQHPNVLRPEFDGEDVIGKEIMAEMFARNFRGIDEHLGKMDLLPPDIRLVDPREKPLVMVRQLGKIVGEGAVSLVGLVRAA